MERQHRRFSTASRRLSGTKSKACLTSCCLVGATPYSTFLRLDPIMKQVLYNETASPVQLRCRWVCAQPSYQRCRSSGKQSIKGILRRHGHLRNHQSERGRQPRRPKNDATSFLGSKRRPGAPVSRMKQRGRSMSLATHPAVFSNFSSQSGSCGSSPPTQSSSWLHIHGIASQSTASR